MTIPEDIVKACKQAGFPSAMVETLIRIHNQQVELEKAINVIRTLQLQMAHIIERQSDVSAAFSLAIANLAQYTGYDPNEQVSAEDIGQG